MTVARTLSIFIVATCFASAANPPSLKARIDAIADNSPAIAKGFAGIRVVRLSDGHVLYERNQDHLFAPASNTKLFTTALALTTLGPQYRFTTTVLSNHGDLVLVGAGDPSISPRHYPYEKPPPDYSPSPSTPFPPSKNSPPRLPPLD